MRGVLARGPLTPHRYLGVAGSVTLAAGAYQVGALPGRADMDTLPGLVEAPGIVACLAGLLGLTVAWWRIGVVTSPSGNPPPRNPPPRNPPSGSTTLGARWVLVTAALWALPLLVAPPIASRDVYAYACQGAVFQAGLDPHTTGAAGLPCPWLDSVPPIWRDAASPYGPLATLLFAGAAAASGGEVMVVVGLLRLIAVVGVVLAAWYGRGLARACGVSGARAAWLALASPLVGVHAIAGAHLDALLTGLVIAACTAATGRRGGAAGLVLGFAIAVKATALVALPFVALLLVPAATNATTRSARRALGRALATVLASAAAGYAVLAVTTGLGLGFLRGLRHTGELVQWTSVPTAVGMTVGYGLRAAGVGVGVGTGVGTGVDTGVDTAVAAARLLGLAAAAAVGAAVCWRAWRAASDRVRPTVAGAGVAFAAVAVLGPVFYPWYALTPLALLAVSTPDGRIRARLAAASAVLAFLILPNGAGLAARTKLPGALAVTATAAALAVRRARRGLPTRSRRTGS